MIKHETCKKCFFYKFAEIKDGDPVRNMCTYTKKHTVFLNRKLAKKTKCRMFITRKSYIKNRRKVMFKFKVFGVIAFISFVLFVFWSVL